MATIEEIAREMLKQRPVTAKEVARKVGLPLRTVQRELGKTGAKLLRAWQTSIWYLKGDEEKAREVAKAMHEAKQRKRGMRLTPKRKRVLEALKSGKWETRGELAEHLGESTLEAHRIVGDLVAGGWVKERRETAKGTAFAEA